MIDSRQGPPPAAVAPTEPDRRQRRCPRLPPLSQHRRRPPRPPRRRRLPLLPLRLLSGRRRRLPPRRVRPRRWLDRRLLRPPVPTSSAAPPATVLSSAGDRVIPFSNMRRRTAEHMVRSKATSPHAFIANEVDFENVERVRRAWGERFKAEEGFSLTYLPFVARAAVEALRDYPDLNASVVDDCARRPPADQSGRRRRPRPRRADRAGRPPGRGGDPARRGPADPGPRRPGAYASADRPTTSPAGRSRSPTTGRSAPSSPCRSSTSPRWPSWPPTGSVAVRWW